MGTISFGDNRANRRRERYRRSNRFVLSTDARGRISRRSPLSSGENAVVHGESDKPADVSLLRVVARAERFPFS